MTIARLILLLPAIPSVSALLLSATVAYGQQAVASDKDEKHCRVLTAKRGESAQIVPDDQVTPGRAGDFPYLVDDTHLREDFRVDDDRRRDCMAYFGLEQAASAAGAAAAAAAAPGGVATIGAGIGAGIGTISAGAIALGGLVVITTGVAIGLASGGGQTGSPTSTTPPAE